MKIQFKHIICAISILFLHFSLIAQTYTKDSAKNPKAFESIKADFQTAEAAFATSDVETIFSSYNNALKTARENDFKSSEGDVLHAIGRVYVALNMLDTATYIFKQAAEIRGAIHDSLNLNKTLTQIGNIYLNQGNYTEGLLISERAIQAGETAKYKRGTGIAYQLHANLLFKRDRSNEALDYYAKARTVFQEIGFEAGVGMTYNGIANVYSKKDEYDNALEYYRKFYDLQKRLGNKHEVANAALNIGSYYAGDLESNSPRQNFDSSFYYYNMALELFEEQNVVTGVVQTSVNLSFVNTYFGDLQKAQFYITKAEEIAKKYSIERELGNINTAKGLLEYKKGNYKAALEHYEVSEKYFAQNREEEKLMMCYKRMYKTHEKLGNFKDAMTYCIMYSDKNDTLNKRSSARMQAEFFNNEKYKEKLEEIKQSKRREQDLQQINQAQNRFNLVLKIGLGAIALFLLLVFYQFLQKRKANKLLTQSNEEILQQKEEIEVQRNQVLEQKDIIEEQQMSILDSIHYASRIQSAILPQEEMQTEMFNDNLFVLFKPRDIVSGDFYWLGKKGNKKIIVAADCTGHGVPGAFMSMLGTAFLNEIITSADDDVKSNQILDELREYVITSLRQTGKTGEQKDGMDLTICIYDEETRMIDFTGANNPLIIVRPSSEDPGIEASKEVKIQEFVSEANNREFNIIQIQGNKMPIGIYADQKPFENMMYQLLPGDSVYAFSDGYQDQFGGPKNKKFMIKKLKQLFVNLYSFDMASQRQLLDKTLVSWIEEAETEQVDDILVIGFKVQ